MDKTKEIYEFIFKDQLEKNKKITKEDIQKLENNKSFFGNKLIDGEIILYFMIGEKTSKEGEITHINIKFEKFMYPSEFELFLSRYNFVRFNKFPMFVKKDIM